MSRISVKCAPTDPELLALLARAKGYRMTPAEKTAQRRSWVRGELMLENPDLTWEEADARVRRAEREMYGDLPE